MLSKLLIPIPTQIIMFSFTIENILKVYKLVVLSFLYNFVKQLKNSKIRTFVKTKLFFNYFKNVNSFSRINKMKIILQDCLSILNIFRCKIFWNIYKNSNVGNKISSKQISFLVK